MCFFHLFFLKYKSLGFVSILEDRNKVSGYTLSNHVSQLFVFTDSGL